MRTLTRLALTASLPVFLLSASLRAAEISGWVADAPPVVPVRAAYLKINNTSSAAISVINISSPQFSSAQLHETVLDGYQVSMQALSGLNISANAVVAMEPGGLHVMLYKPKEKLMVGDCVELVVELSDGKSKTVRLDVREVGAHVGHAHH